MQVFFAWATKLRLIIKKTRAITLLYYNILYYTILTRLSIVTLLTN